MASFSVSFLIVRAVVNLQGSNDEPAPTLDLAPAVASSAASVPNSTEGNGVPVLDMVTGHGLAHAVSRKLSREERERLRFGDWALRDPRAALEAAMARIEENGDSDDEHLMSLVDTVIRCVVETDPDLALELGRIADSGCGYSYVGVVFTAWPEERLGEVPAILMEMKDSGGAGSDYQTLGHAATLIANRWPADDSEALLVWVVQVFAGISSSDTSVTRAMGERTLGGVGFLSTIPEEPNEARLLALKAVIRQDPQLGLTGLDLVDEEHRTEALYFITNKIFDDDPESGLRFLRDLFHELYDAESDTFVESSGSALESLMWDITDAYFGEELDPKVLRELPVPARNFFLIDVPPAEDAQWVSMQGNTTGASRHAFWLSGYWAKEDPQAVAEWLTDMDPGITRDHAIAGFVRSISEDDPAAGTDWADAIAEPALRERFMRVALRHWMAADPVAGAEAVRGSGLSEMAVDSLLTP